MGRFLRVEGSKELPDSIADVDAAGELGPVTEYTGTKRRFAYPVAAILLLGCPTKIIAAIV